MNETPATLRSRIRTESFKGTTAGLHPDFIQTNLVILPEEEANAFRDFAKKNPVSCPVLEEFTPGETESTLAPGSDIRTDVPAYRVYRFGELAEKRTDIQEIWQDDFVTFLIGCSFTFEHALMQKEIPLRHVAEEKTVPMFVTSLETTPSGPFCGPVVVSMRPIPAHLVEQAQTITAQFPSVHGAPIHIGAPEEIAIADLSQPDYGEAVTVNDGEVPVFWGCGVTPQQAILRAACPFAITHEPGAMFVTDSRHEKYREQAK
ncbi:Uncharacterized protein YcsI, UPF0317 family [Salisediminibacterium halotolerans]|uniref:Uncharacterized protein YcsI, UPF0317 family n=2 Tax=Salisediminibacterium halotolerans TaxID=517425 RepID=A0A1H9UC08_9BACI|nr:Uncharacterized protein YcsI, UPF0317 family [Salisediminibacterium haloalkalitolerans]